MEARTRCISQRFLPIRAIERFVCGRQEEIGVAGDAYFDRSSRHHEAAVIGPAVAKKDASIV